MILYVVLALAGCAIYGSHWLLGTMKPKPNEAKEELKKTIVELKVQAEELNSPSTYAAYSKLNRQIQSMETKLSEMQDFTGHSDLYWVVAIMPYVAVLLFIGQSHEMHIYGEEVYWPIHNFIGHQDGKVYHFSLWSWYIISLIVIKSLTR